MPATIPFPRLLAAYQRASGDLLAERHQAGHWIGELATSALSTATAISALSLTRKHRGDESLKPLIERGCDWLASQQNDDGGWGDTAQCYSNIATTMLAVAALQLAGRAAAQPAAVARAESYIDAQGRLAGLRARYGKDKTFAAPILANCALAGITPWRDVAVLPFELACFPQSFYRFLRMPVVSYAIPALVAVGQARYFHRPPWNPLLRLLRAAAVRRSADALRDMQPASGGYLEATPLTSFVVMSLAATGRATHPVVQQGVRFLRDSVQADGSWPIDTNLATWNTSLSLNALASGGEDIARLTCLPWLLSCQHRQRHPFTGAEPGGWGWSDLSGAVPDSDDTPGALLALAAWRDAASCRPQDLPALVDAVAAGVGWLLRLQNSDGGWPTFCRGWGRLPFDRSGADLTAHAVRALAAWQGPGGAGKGGGLFELARRFDVATPYRAADLDRAVDAGFRFLERSQQPDGAWIPLWFGNQDQPRQENPVYGTARVLLAYRDLKKTETSAAVRGFKWLREAQNDDGGWGGGVSLDPRRQRACSSVEETALAIETGMAAGGDEPLREAVDRGLQWLVEATETGGHRRYSPIGFYFAKLWYHERLYPLVFTTAALGQAVQQRLVDERPPAHQSAAPSNQL